MGGGGVEMGWWGRGGWGGVRWGEVGWGELRCYKVQTMCAA